MKNTHRKLIELKDLLQNNSLGGIHLTNLPQHYWELLGECIEETGKTLKIERFRDILGNIVSEDPYCGVEGENAAITEIIEYLNENDIEVI